ncbi:hypothetical protein KP77_00820 [Jeotgalibacillus alimentarius]|uniref:Uncharacterized protein n=1 Tax=Jeotgalibacillus alimentarius TaxID=135826 RepID=A0A0C2SIH2_9BACL|nr:hypothetical protein KP77_00820 [Jeotgalibacillus alimentarius]
MNKLSNHYKGDLPQYYAHAQKEKPLLKSSGSSHLVSMTHQWE